MTRTLKMNATELEMDQQVRKDVTEIVLVDRHLHKLDKS
jgi:hypothetical protein